MNPLISIVLTIFNGEDYLSVVIDSCLNQGCKNIEVIILNNCPIDRVFEITNHYAVLDERFVVNQNYKCLYDFAMVVFNLITFEKSIIKSFGKSYISKLWNTFKGNKLTNF